MPQRPPERRWERPVLFPLIPRVLCGLFFGEGNVQISIEYCGTCNYRPIAASLAMAIQQTIGVVPVLVHSNRSGAFEVRADGEILFSKLRSGSFPTKEEVLAGIRRRGGHV